MSATPLSARDLENASARTSLSSRLLHDLRSHLNQIIGYADMLTEDFTLEDPTARMRADGREKIRAVLNALLAKGEYGVVHWEVDRRLTDGEWVVVEGTWRGMFKNRPFATRFTTWVLVRGDKVARQIDYLDYQTFRRQTEPRK